jgi:uncharacterized SAM-binding protein YcdF (DUF218 family)
MVSAIFNALISPLGTCLLFGLVGLLLSRASSARTSRSAGFLLASFGLLWLLVWSTPLASHSIRAWLERQPAPRLVEDVPAAPAIVVLGGGVVGASPPWRNHPDMRAAADRVWHAARLYHAGKAPLVLVTGGYLRTGSQSEADAMQTLLQDLGVPVAAIVQENRSHNTLTNAQYTARLLSERGMGSAILVTSALHMPRARKHFEATGLKIVAAPADFEVADIYTDWQDLLPDTRALDGSTRAFKELAGHWLSR